MPCIAYVNGRYVPLRTAQVGVQDRGLQFSDGVYEVLLAFHGRMLDQDRHLDRLDRSLAELQIPVPMSRGPFTQILNRLVRLNRADPALIYVQVNRGEARRDHAFPVPVPQPSLMVTCRRFDVVGVRARQTQGVAVITTPDLRWKRCDIKSVSLLGNVLAKQEARQQRAYEAWMTDDKGVTEGSSSTAWIVKDGRLITRALGRDLLPGVTRAVVTDLTGVDIIERPFSVGEAQDADEAFVTSASSFVTPVVAIDGKKVGKGMTGPVTAKLIAAHWDHVAHETGFSFVA